MNAIFTHLRKETRAKHAKGFTLVETLVAITILLVGIMGPLLLVNDNIDAASFSRNQITASYLAQEAIEVVRQVRDDDFLITPLGNPYSSNLFECIAPESSEDGCRIDGRSGVAPKITECDNCDGSAQLQMNKSTGEYGHTSNLGFEDSDFYRYVQIDLNLDPGASVRALVRVRVGFDAGSYVQEYETTSLLTTWVQ